MNSDTWHEPSAWRHPDSRKKADRKPQEPFVNEMPTTVYRCRCGRLWATRKAMAAHVARGCAVREEETYGT